MESLAVSSASERLIIWSQNSQVLLGCSANREFVMRIILCALLQRVEIRRHNICRMKLVVQKISEFFWHGFERKYSEVL